MPLEQTEPGAERTMGEQTGRDRTSQEVLGKHLGNHPREDLGRWNSEKVKQSGDTNEKYISSSTRLQASWTLSGL
jgi:hypothetical protein